MSYFPFNFNQLKFTGTCLPKMVKFPICFSVLVNFHVLTPTSIRAELKFSLIYTMVSMFVVVMWHRPCKPENHYKILANTYHSFACFRDIVLIICCSGRSWLASKCHSSKARLLSIDTDKPGSWYGNPRSIPQLVPLAQFHVSVGFPANLLNRYS